LLQSPFGLSALVYCITGFAVGSFQGGVLRATRWIPVVSAFAASALGTVAFAVTGSLLGLDGLVNTELVTIAVVVGVVNAALVLPAMRVMRWALPDPIRIARLA
jgi:hypothetical protein